MQPIFYYFVFLSYLWITIYRIIKQYRPKKTFNGVMYAARNAWETPRQHDWILQKQLGYLIYFIDAKGNKKWANAHKTRHSISLISYAGCLGLGAYLQYAFALPYLTLPSGRMPAISRHPALRPQHGPSAHPRQTSRSTEPLWSFDKPQEEMPMDVTQRIQWKSKITSISFRRSIKALHWAIRCTVLVVNECTKLILFSYLGFLITSCGSPDEHLLKW